MYIYLTHVFTPSLTHNLGQIPLCFMVLQRYLVTFDQHNVEDLVVGRCDALLWALFFITPHTFLATLD